MTNMYKLDGRHSLAPSIEQEDIEDMDVEAAANSDDAGDNYEDVNWISNNYLAKHSYVEDSLKSSTQYLSIFSAEPVRESIGNQLSNNCVRCGEDMRESFGNQLYYDTNSIGNHFDELKALGS